jgi:hypothetical protein
MLSPCSARNKPDPWDFGHSGQAILPVKAAKHARFEVRPTLLGRADEVIE